MRLYRKRIKSGLENVIGESLKSSRNSFSFIVLSPSGYQTVVIASELALVSPVQ